MIFRWLSCGFVLAMLLGSATLKAQEVQRPKPALSKDATRVIVLQGTISQNMVRSLRESLPEEVVDTFPAGLIVFLDSPGGDGFAAMELGELLRRAKAHVFVTGQCASACVLVLASGVVRVAPAYTVGLHRGRVTVSYADGKVKKELNPQVDQEAARVFREFETKAQQYFVRMGVDESFFEKMQKFERRSVYRLNNQEMRQYGIVGFEPKYLRERVQWFSSLAHSQAITADELTQRVLRVSRRCGGLEIDKAAFVKCYRESLLSSN